MIGKLFGHSFADSHRGAGDHHHFPGNLHAVLLFCR
jgi:hypothetical protein